MRMAARETAAILALVAAITAVRLVSGVSLSDLGIPRLFADTREPRSAARYEPSSPEIARGMVILAGVTGNDTVYDLGSGDGRVVITAARMSGARGIGVDIEPGLVSESRRNAERANVSHLVRFSVEDLFTTDIRSASVVMLYLSPAANFSLRPRLLSELKPGSRIVSHSHTMGEWEPDKEAEVEGHHLYFWVVPADVSGSWKLNVTGIDAEAVIEFVQDYQKVRGGIRSGREGYHVTGARLSGKTIRFTAERAFGGLPAPADFTGDVEGDRITGTYRSLSRTGKWKAERIIDEPET